MRQLSLLSLIAVFMTGCGYKAPLFMPKPKSEAQKQGIVVVPEPAPDRPVPAEATPAPK